MSVHSFLPLLLAAALPGCGGENCLDPLPRDCQPAYEPIFDNIHQSTLVPSCTLAGCHDAATAQADLSYENAQEAYDGLTGKIDGVNRALAGDPECSLLVQRIESSDPDVRMPPSGPLSAGERCAILLWVDRGAAR